MTAYYLDRLPLPLVASNSQQIGREMTPDSIDNSSNVSDNNNSNNNNSGNKHRKHFLKAVE